MTVPHIAAASPALHSKLNQPPTPPRPAHTPAGPQPARAASGAPGAPRYRKISGTGSVEQITARALEALA